MARAVVLLLVGTTFAIGAGTLVTGLSQSPLASDISNNGRYRIWGLIWDQFKSNPLQGWGPLAFVPAGGSPLAEVGLEHAHNQFMEAIAETGALGLILTTIVLGALGWIALRERRRPVYLAVFLVLVASLPSEPFMSPYLYGLNYTFVPIIVVLVVILSAGMRPEIPERAAEGWNVGESEISQQTPSDKMDERRKVNHGFVDEIRNRAANVQNPIG